jgi:hypothetical protein
VLLEELENDMVYYGNKLEDLTKDFEYRKGKVISDVKKDGYLHLEQDCGYGETRIILCENELDKECLL